MDQTSIIKKVKSLPGLFQNLSGQAARDLLKIARFKEYAPGEYLFTQHDDVSKTLYLIKQGKVEIYQTSQGRKFITQLLEPGDIFGYPDLAQANKPSSYSARALEGTELLILDRLGFESLLKKHPLLCERLIAALAQKFILAQERLKDLALANTRIRVLNELLTEGVKRGEMKQGGLEFKKEFIHEHLAQRLGLSRETVTRTLNELRNEAVIYIKRNKVVIDAVSFKGTRK